MSTPPSQSGLEKIQIALSRGKLDEVRRGLLQLNEEERSIIIEELGESRFRRLLLAAGTVQRGRKRGRVIVMHGIMGAMLDSVDRSGDPDRIWVNYWNLFKGRIDELELDERGEPKKPGYYVRVVGPNRKTYLSMILELDKHWDVRPFAYDWRENIDRSVERLAGEIRAWAHGEPVHIVAHSMGGLVARRFVQLHKDLWRKMQDPKNPEAGGRLIMLGTPNRGSFSIPMALSGTEKLVKYFAKLDIGHGMKSLLKILNSFPGTYQMLPSPLIDLGDDHGRLFDKRNWGTIPVQSQHLRTARQFQTQLHDVIDKERFFYIAGYNRETPHRIKIVSSGKFELGTTWDGDGRVPHVLGLLPGVPVYWSSEGHGDLPKNEEVIGAVDELLTEGRTGHLADQKPTKRARGVSKKVSVEAIDEEKLAVILGTARGKSRGKTSQLSSKVAARLDGLILRDYLGGIADTESAPYESPGPPKQDADRPRRGAPKPELAVEVVWGDITEVQGDVYAVGHYEGVLPQNAELALDRALSGDKKPYVITEHTRQGRLRGALGDVDFFPRGDPDHREQVVAVAGMGRPGSFGLPSLRRLVRELTASVATLPSAVTACTVLIGSGEGTLSIKEAVEGLLKGLTDALASEGITTGIRLLRIVEWYRHRAIDIQEELSRAAKAKTLKGPISFRVADRVKRGPGGKVADEHALSLILDTAVRFSALPESNESRKALDRLISKIESEELRTYVEDALEKKVAERKESPDWVRPAYPGHVKDIHVSFEGEPKEETVPTRISFFEEKGVIRAAAISNTATVAERIVSVDPNLIQEIVDEINDPYAPPMENLPSFLTRLMLPKDFRDLLRTKGTFVFELDRRTAQIHWEIMAQEVGERAERIPLGIESVIARQLRTTYSPAPEELDPQDRVMRALVIGDPGDPDKGESLPGARREALEVSRTLQAQKNPKIEVTTLIGAPNGPRRDLPRDVEPAKRIDVLNRLMHERYDLLHYCGHGDFDPKNPDRVGWVFAGGLLTAHEIGRADWAPSLIVANACLSSRLSEVTEGGTLVREKRSEAGLLPSLADEFFHLGVRNYIGTAWPVNDVGAVCFAKKLYKTWLGGKDLGKAVTEARKVLYDERDSFGKLWAAYQHYGDPTSKARKPERGSGG